MNKYTIFVAEIGCRNFNFDENVITNLVVLYKNPRISCNLIRGFPFYNVNTIGYSVSKWLKEQ